MLELNPYSFMLDEMVWSYSRVETYSRCPLCFLKTYILKEPKEDNAFNIYGNIIHNILEDYANGKLEIFELVDVFKKKFEEEMTIPFPPSPRFGLDMKELYFNQGIAYFEEFEGFPNLKEIVGVEEKVDCNIGRFKFTGKIDLIFRNEKGELEIVDHKSDKKIKQPSERTWKSEKMRRKGYLYKKMRQLNLYAYAVKQKYGEYPKWLNYNVFRTGEWVRVPFNLEDMQDAEFWFVNEIKNIYEDETMSKHYDDDHFCGNICSVRFGCEFSDSYEEDY